MWKIETIRKKQRKYKTGDRCEMKRIFDDLNDWQVVKLETSKSDDIYKDNLAKEKLYGIESRMSDKIMRGDYGEMRMDDPDIDGYYIVEWNYNVYTTQDDSYGRIKPSWVCVNGWDGVKIRFWNPASKKKLGYTNIRRRRWRNIKDVASIDSRNQVRWDFGG